MKEAGLQLTKQVFMSLISAYATCGQLEKAKQVHYASENFTLLLQIVSSDLCLVLSIVSHG